MYQRFKLLILFLCAIASATAVFGANAARVGNNVGNNQAHMVSLDSRQQPLTDWGLESSASDIAGKPGSSETAMGYFMSPGIIQIGVTSYDLQHNMRQARQIAVGSDGRVHMVWTHKLVLGSLNTRAVHYRSFKNLGLGGTLTAEKSISDLLSKIPGRFCTVDAFGDIPVVVYHWGPSATSSTTDAMDIGSGTGAFYTVSPDIPAGVINCENIYAGSAFQPYIWPVAAADHDANKLVVHAVASEGNTGAGFSAIVYFRGASSSTILEGGMYGTCGKFIDSCSATGYDVAASPYNDDVVIVYPLARQGNRENNDLAYRLSHDIGVTWGDPVNVTNFATGALERVAGDMSVLFTADNCFHILYIGNIYDSLANTVSDQEAKLYHWSSCNPTCKSLVLDANNHDNACNTPAFEYDVSKITLTQCHSNALGKDLLYAVYARQLGTTADPDCSDKGYFNQEVFVSPSSTWGETWGESINLTNTKTDGCDPMAATPTYCADESFTSSARYVNDSLRIEYLEDLDAGSFVSNESGTKELLNPVKFISYPCIDMAPYRVLSSTPNAIKYPFHAVTNATATQDLLLVNGGNLSINWIATTLGGDAPITLLPGSGTVPAGCPNSATITATVGPRSTEGLFTNTIRFTYDSPAKTLDVPVDFYVFDSWFLPQDVPLRTATNRMVVNQAGQAADNILGSSFTYFADLSENFIKDASLIMGNSAQNLSWRIFESGQSEPTPGNNFGWLYALTNTDADSTTYYPGPNGYGYRIAQGSGTNRDSTVGYDVAWYAPRHVDSADFFVGHFEVYKGTKATGDVNGLCIAFACDWDVPSDSSSSNNSVGIDEARQMIYLQGTGTGKPGTTYIPRTQGFGGTAAYREDGVPIAGGFAFGNKEQVYPNRGYHVDSVWKYMQLTPGYTSRRDTTTDQTIVMVVAKGYTLTSTHLKFDVVLLGKRAQDNPTGLAGLNTVLCKAKQFIYNYISQSIVLCPSCNSCGDANDDGGIDISDAVFLLSYIFSGGAAPHDCNGPNAMGDANGDGRISVVDGVFLICYIFADGPAPHCAEGYRELGQDTGVQDTIAIMCPTIVPSNHLVAGDSFRVEVYLYNDEIINGFSAGFGYTSDLIEITSVDFSGSIIPVGGYRRWRCDPVNKRCLIGSALDGELNTFIPARTQRGLLCALNVRMLPSIGAGDVDIDTVFVPPAGFLELVSGSGCGSNTFVPEYADCGVSDIRLGDELALTFSPALDVCPAGDAPFRVTLKDGLGNPIVGDTAIRITLENCGGVRTCSSPSLPSTLYPIGPSDANGQVTFYTSGLNCGSSCQAVIRRKTGVYGTIPVRSFDRNGDLTVSILNDFDFSLCNDFNGNNQIDFNDENLIAEHNGHTCNIDACRLFGYDFHLNPSSNLDSGQVVTLQLILSNNNQAQSCYIGFVGFYYSIFGTGGEDHLIQTYPYNDSLRPGQQDTLSIQYTIPGYDPRCLKAKFTTSCCGSVIELSKCLSISRPCQPGASICYEFNIQLNDPAAAWFYRPYLLADWDTVWVHKPSLPIIQDSIVYRICTPDLADLGDSSSVVVYVCGDDNCLTASTFVNQVVVTSNTGDANGDCFVDISDAVYLIAYIFSGGSGPVPYRAGDVNCDDFVDISDVVYLIAYIFSGGIPPCLVMADFFTPDFGQ